MRNLIRQMLYPSVYEPGIFDSRYETGWGHRGVPPASLMLFSLASRLPYTEIKRLPRPFMRKMSASRLPQDKIRHLPPRSRAAPSAIKQKICLNFARLEYVANTAKGIKSKGENKNTYLPHTAVRGCYVG